MQDIEPFYSWRELYIASDDKLSVFYRKKYNETECTNTIYNYYIHPQWDDFGSQTLYLKVLYTNYTIGFTVIELMGEWNDCLYNDIMLFKRNLIESLIGNGVNKFILIGENVLNFHASDDLYYEEWFEEIEDGWIAALNFRKHVLNEFETIHLGYYIAYGGALNNINWRAALPEQIYNTVAAMVTKRLNP
jgi:hypothetical protein